MSPQAPAVRRWAVIPAAGSSERMRTRGSKQYLSVCGRTLLEHALHPFLAHAGIHGIVVVLAAGDETWNTLSCACDVRVRTAVGGAERMHSVLRGLQAIEHDARPHDWVLVHDAARPCLGRADLDRLLAALDEDPIGGLLAVPIGDTVKRADETGAHVAATVERTGLWAAQTPQMFRYDLLHRALAQSARDGVAMTDEAAAVEALGSRPRLVEGNARNIKVTRDEDLTLVEAILRSPPNGA